MRILSAVILSMLVAASLPAADWQTAANLPSQLEGVGLEQRLNQPVPKDLAFQDENGNPVKIGDYFGERPVILSLVYFNCPMLCPRVLNGLISSLKGMNLEPGKDFDLLTVSFNPAETSKLAAAKKQALLGQYGNPSAGPAWHFLTGNQDSITALTDAAGFHYTYDEKSGQFAHPSAIIVLTPEGHFARYFSGVDYPPRDLRLSLVEASHDQIGNPVDQVLLYCYHYDPATGKYGIVVWNVIRVTSFSVLFLLSGFLYLMFRRERRKQAAQDALGTDGRRAEA